jgi:hypothetical protein
MDLGDVIGSAMGDTGSVDSSLYDLARQAAAAVDTFREAKAAAEVLKRDLLSAMKAAKIESIALEDRTIMIKHGKRANKTLKALKEIVGDAKAKEIWGQFPSKPTETIECPDPSR